MRTYVDSSVVLRHILKGDQALNALSPSDEVSSSDLLIIECQRVLQRERMAAHLDDQQQARKFAFSRTTNNWPFVLVPWVSA